MQELSEKYDRACLDSCAHISHLKAENGMVRRQHAEKANECKALRDELAVVRGELHSTKALVIVIMLTEVEAMEKRAGMERGSTKEALMQILLLNEIVLSFVVMMIGAEEERSMFFHTTRKNRLQYRLITYFWYWS
jgi:hypothetical protein